MMQLTQVFAAQSPSPQRKKQTPEQHSSRSHPLQLEDANDAAGETLCQDAIPFSDNLIFISH